MKLKIKHTTSYTYDAPVTYSLQQVRLSPVSNSQQSVLDWNVEIEGGSVELRFLDQYKNQTLLVQVEPGQKAVTVTASGEVETNDTAGVLGKVYSAAPLWLFTQSTPRTAPGKNVRKLAKIIGSSDNQLSDLHNLSKEILRAAPYDKTATFAGMNVEEALSAGGGVCQDHAQMFVSATRLAGIPARYVSGYLMMNNRVNQEASHAWAEAHLDGLGWVGFDVSNGISPDERYVRVATGLDSRDAAPISGMRQGSATESMIVSLQVQQ